MFVMVLQNTQMLISGADSASFLQGLTTNDVHVVVPGSAQYSVFLLPKGRVLSDAFIVNGSTPTCTVPVFYLDVHTLNVEILRKHLRKYRLRAKVDISDASNDFKVVSFLNGAFNDDIPESICFPDPRTKVLGTRALIPVSSMSYVGKIAFGSSLNLLCAAQLGVDCGDEVYRLWRMLCGVTEG
jgi:hypothetical protein